MSNKANRLSRHSSIPLPLCNIEKVPKANTFLNRHFVGADTISIYKLASFSYVTVPGDCLGFLKVELPLTKDWLFFHTFANTLVIDKPCVGRLPKTIPKYNFNTFIKRPTDSRAELSAVSRFSLVVQSVTKSVKRFSNLLSNLLDVDRKLAPRYCRAVLCRSIVTLLHTPNCPRRRRFALAFVLSSV